MDVRKMEQGIGVATTVSTGVAICEKDVVKLEATLVE